jgi:hypothetical protein
VLRRTQNTHSTPAGLFVSAPAFRLSPKGASLQRHSRQRSSGPFNAPCYATRFNGVRSGAAESIPARRSDSVLIKKMHFPLQPLRCVTRENNFCKVTREKGEPTGAAEKPPTSTPLQKLYSTLLRKIIIKKRERARTVAAKLRHSSCAKHTRPMMYLTPRRYKNWAK